MSKFKNTNSAVAFIDYKPAELHKNKEWRIVYYAKVPTKNELKRFRVRIPKIKNLRERNKTANKMVLSINQKLACGWSPFYEDKSNQYKSIDEVFQLFIDITEREVEDGLKRQPTLKSYRSKLGIFKTFIKEQLTNLHFFIELDVYVINSYFDYLYMNRKVSPKTYNNHISMLGLFFEFCVSKGFIKENPVRSIKKKMVNKKKREVLSQANILW
ncbi:MAG: phage integrase SAM-like domain-containing protein [Flavobacteriaceae bacterium]|nr:phage integrase SAM-like domain-containing protein [Flavobacteriaceae bacterium]